MIKSSSLFTSSRPLSVRISNKIFNDDEPSKKESALTVSITDVYGGQILASNDQTSVQITKSKETSIKKEGPTGPLTQKDSNTYQYAFGDEVRKLTFDDGPHGIYQTVITVDDENLSEQLTIKVT